MPRKTIYIETLQEMVNERNEKSTCSPAERQGWNSLLETVLHDAGQYAGYTYLREDDVPKGEKPGIIFDDENHNHQYPDETRRQYFMKKYREV